MMPLYTPEEREEIAEGVSRLLYEDGRVEGIVVGSLASQPDRWSDIDLEVVVADNADLAAVAAEWVNRPHEVLAVLHHFETAFGDTLVRGLLLENLLEIDLAFTLRAHFEVWGPARLAFDRSGHVEAILEVPTKPDPSPRAGRVRPDSRGTMFSTPAPPFDAAGSGRHSGTFNASEIVRWGWRRSATASTPTSLITSMTYRTKSWHCSRTRLLPHLNLSRCSQLSRLPPAPFSSSSGAGNQLSAIGSKVRFSSLFGFEGSARRWHQRGKTRAEFFDAPLRRC
jgi:predicted nucleotidyltransferase